MLVIGEVKCLHCGYLSGQWVGPGGAPLTMEGFRPAGRQPATAEAAEGHALVRCLRCAGPVFLDDASAVRSSARIRRIRRMREQIAALEDHRKRAA